jgi:hypothetical protein
MFRASADGFGLAAIAQSPEEQAADATPIQVLVASLSVRRRSSHTSSVDLRLYPLAVDPND